MAEESFLDMCWDDKEAVSNGSDTDAGKDQMRLSKKDCDIIIT